MAAALSTQTLPALAAFALAAVWTPGPNNFLLASSGATFGLRRTLPHALGVAVGFPVMMFLVTLGLGEVFRTEPAVRAAVAWVGLVVMLWLAARLALQSGVGGRPAAARPITFTGAALFQWVNPKAWVTAIAVAATYASGAAPRLEALIAAAVFLASGLSSAAGWAAAGASLGRFVGEGRRLRVFNVAMAALLALSAIWLVVAG